jgi:hypothetical protein
LISNSHADHTSAFYTTTADIFKVEVGLLNNQWKAMHVVCDNNLAEKLCDALKTILVETPLTECSKHFLLQVFTPTLLVDEEGMVDRMCLKNPNEAQVSVILLSCEFKLSLWGRATGYYSSVFPRR